MENRSVASRRHLNKLFILNNLLLPSRHRRFPKEQSCNGRINCNNGAEESFQTRRIACIIKPKSEKSQPEKGGVSK